MHIRCAALDGVKQDFVNEANNGGTFDIVTADVVLFFIDTCDIQVFKIEVLVIER